MEWDKIWAVNKQLLDPVVPRYTAIGKNSSVKLTIENGPSPPEARTQPLHPKNAAVGNKAVVYGQNLLVEKEDAKALAVGQKITLMKWGNATITRREDVGDSFELFANIDEEDKDFKGTLKLTWITNDPATVCEVKMVEFDHLINKAKIEEDDDNEAIFNRNSKFEDIGIAEGFVNNLSQGSYFQFERRGFYYVDKIAMVNNLLTVHFIPDGKTRGMSVLTHQVDAGETSKGKAASENAAVKQVAGVGADGKLSKKALAKLNKKDAKNNKKAGGAPAEGEDKAAIGKAKKEAAAKAKAVAVSAVVVSTSRYF